MIIKIILAYDICTEDKAGQRRLVKALKTCRKYLTHVQKSVFEGDLTEGKFLTLAKEIESFIDKNQDFVIIYQLNDGVKLHRNILTNTADPTDNFL